MIAVIKYFVLTVLALLAGIIVLSLLAKFVFFGDARGCDKDSASAEYARALTQVRLEQLYFDMATLYNDESVPYEGYSSYESGLPDQFSDLDVAIVRPKQANITVVGCFDHYLYLRFNGFRNNEPKSIELQYGEHEIGTEILWSKK